MLDEKDILERGWELINDPVKTDGDVFWKGSRIYHKDGYFLQTTRNTMNYYIIHGADNLYKGFFIDADEFDQVCKRLGVLT